MLSLELVPGAEPKLGGKPVQSSLSDDAMLLLWEAVLGSIRIRPAATSNRIAAVK